MADLLCSGAPVPLGRANSSDLCEPLTEPSRGIQRSDGRHFISKRAHRPTTSDASDQVGPAVMFLGLSAVFRSVRSACPSRRPISYAASELGRCGVEWSAEQIRESPEDSYLRKCTKDGQQHRLVMLRLADGVARQRLRGWHCTDTVPRGRRQGGRHPKWFHLRAGGAVPAGWKKASAFRKTTRRRKVRPACRPLEVPSLYNDHEAD